MKSFTGLLLATVAGAGLLAASVPSASAAIICSGDACWHAQTAYEYPASSHVIVHEDDWHWGPSDHFRWREHAGRGFWHDDAWEDF